MKRIFTVLIVMSMLLMSVSIRASALPAAPDISARSCILIHCGDGRVLYEKNADAKMLIASTTQIMTAIVVIKNCSMSDRIVIKPGWCGAEGSSMYLKAGQSYTVEQLLTGMMLVSGNDAAVALACYTAGSVVKFAKLMNSKAQELGMTGSSFKNPNGLDEKGHYSTAGDMAKLTQYCMQNQAFRSIVSQKSADIGGRTLVNHNKLLWSLKGCIGVKTGYTMACGRLLVSCCERDGTRLVCVTLSDPNDWTDHTALYEWAFRNYGYKKVISRNMTLSLPVVSGTETAVTVSPDRDIRLFLPADADICYRVDLPRFVFGGIEKGEDAGELAVLSGDRELASAKLIYDMTVLTERTVKVGAWNALTKLW